MTEQYTSPTRTDYMNGSVTHHEYYRCLGREAGIRFSNSDLLPRIQVALANGDEHLNTIPLDVWDQRAATLLPYIKNVFKAHGDTDSLNGRVCVLKQAARDAAERAHGGHIEWRRKV